MSINFPVIGFIGVQGAGKSTAAKLLEKHGYKLSSFATPLKDMLRAIDIEEKYITGSLADKNAKIDILKDRSPDALALRMLEVIGVYVQGNNFNNKRIELMGFTPNEAISLMHEIKLFEVDTSRKFQQLLGTEWGRRINKNFWTHIWNIKAEQNKKQKLVSDDVRFQNEVDLIKFKKGILIKLICEDENENVGIAGHPSEQSNLLKAHATLFNHKNDVLRLENSLLELLTYMS